MSRDASTLKAGPWPGYKQVPVCDRSQFVGRRKPSARQETNGFEWSPTNDVPGTANRGNPAESGLCPLCRADCNGKCETWLASQSGRKLLYPRDFWLGHRRQQHHHARRVNYNALRIQGQLYGTHGPPPGLSNRADDCIFPNDRMGAARARSREKKMPEIRTLRTHSTGSCPAT
jgi:hypothetical protein